MTRARAKLIEQQVNSLLAQPDLCYDENFILPKSMHLCMIRFEAQLDMETMKMDKELDMEAMELNKELDMEDKELDMEDKILSMKTTSECAREEREAGARQEEDVINEKTASEKLQTPTGLSGPRNTGLSGRTEISLRKIKASSGALTVG